MHTWPAIAKGPIYDFAEERATSKQNLKPFRLTCRLFSELYGANSILFHDFQLYVSQDSLSKPNELSLHSELRHHVRRVAFMVPQLDDQYEDFDE